MEMMAGEGEPRQQLFFFYSFVGSQELFLKNVLTKTTELEP